MQDFQYTWPYYCHIVIGFGGIKKGIQTCRACHVLEVIQPLQKFKRVWIVMEPKVECHVWKHTCICFALKVQFLSFSYVRSILLVN